MSRRLIYYDTETTGTRPELDRIVEIAAYDVQKDARFERLVSPGIPIPKEASRIHGITDDMVAQAPSFSEAGQAFIEFCGEDCVLVAHNNDLFDSPFLKHEAARHQLILPQWLTIDTLKWARKYRSDLPRHSLQFLRQIYGIAQNQAHRALDDVVVLHQIFSIMVDDLPVDTILKLMEEAPAVFPSAPSTMPFGKHRGKPLSEIPPGYISWLKGQGVFEKPDHAALKKALEQLGLLECAS